MSQNKILLRSRKKKALGLAQAGNFQEAKSLLNDLCRLDGRDADLWFLLGAVNGQLELYEDAIRCCRKVIELRPDFVDVHFNLAQAYMHLGMPEQAILAYREVVRLNPQHADALNNMGYALTLVGSYVEAMECCKAAILIKPDFADAYNNLGNAQGFMGSQSDGIEFFLKTLQLDPQHIKAQINLGFSRFAEGNFAEAWKVFARVHESDPDNLDATLGIAAIHEKRGEFGAAHEIISPLLEKGVENERLAMVFAKIARHFDRREEAIALLEKLLARGRMRETIVEPLYFNLGKLYDELKQYDKAFPHFVRANQLKPCIDPADFLREMDAEREVCTADFFLQTAHASSSSHRPIFIVGMPRSGTSLVEQILASHPSVHGGGELAAMHEITEALPARLGASIPYPQCLPLLTQEVVDEMAQCYLAKLDELSPDALHVTDKMPHNFRHLGFIALLFPDARIIHCKRNPADNCVSIFTNEFNSAHSYATSLERLGEHYCHYQALMRHWRQVLPLPIFEVQYEEMVAENERMTRALLDFCGLPWDDSCLRFYENKRVVNTISYDQVRQPIYKKSVERWRYYEKHLGPLLSALGQDNAS